jgi:hypothetical protein
MGQIRILAKFLRTERVPNQIRDRKRDQDRQRFERQQANRGSSGRILERPQNIGHSNICRRSQTPELRECAKVPEISNQNNQGNKDRKYNDRANQIWELH